MGLASLIKVAQGKNASNVSFEDSFLKEYEAAVRKKELEERQVAPSDYIRPSSMYGCERMIFFQRVHSGSLNDMKLTSYEVYFILYRSNKICQPRFTVELLAFG